MKSLSSSRTFVWLALLLVAASVDGAVFFIPDGDVTALKNAINAANANGEDDTIEMAVSGIYTLPTADNSAGGDPNGLPIIGPDGGHKLTINGGGAVLQRGVYAPFYFRVLAIGAGANVTINALKISHGYVSGFAGGGVYNDGTLVVNNCFFGGNYAPYGGAVYNSGGGAMTVIDSTFNHNEAGNSFQGGGGAVAGTNFNVVRCTFTNNVSNLVAGAILNLGNPNIATIGDSAFTGNTSGRGGAVENQGFTNANATMTIINSQFDGNQSSGGGAVSNIAGQGNCAANLTVSRCTFSNNGSDSAVGGAVRNYSVRNAGARATATISDSTFVNNYASTGGAVSSSQQTGTGGGNSGLMLSNSTFSGNSAYDGGAIYIRPHPGMAQVVKESTFVGNFVYDDADPTFDGGGALYLNSGFAGAVVTVKDCTLSGNSAPVNAGGIFIFGSASSPTLFLTNTIMKTGVAGQSLVNASGTITSQGYNLSNDSGGGFLNAAGDQINTDPMLDPAGLQNNGGPTQTIALLTGSSAINGGDPNGSARDQRYYLRNGAPDKGAFEFGGALAPLTAASRKTHGTAGTFDVDLPLTGNAGLECRTGGASGDHQVILNFSSPITASGASVTTGVGDVSEASVMDSEITVDLTGVTNAQQIVLTLLGVSDGVNTNDVSIPIRILFGDTNGNGSVNASDVAQTKAQLGQPVSNSNYRNDPNANGTINASDAAIVKSQVGTSIPSAGSGTETATALTPNANRPR